MAIIDLHSSFAFFKILNITNTIEVPGTETVSQESFLMLLQPIFIFSVPAPHELAPAASEYLGSCRNSLSIYSRKQDTKADFLD